MGAEGLTPGCRNMLITGIRGSLSIPSVDRQEVHTLMLGMVHEVILAGERRLQEVLDAAEDARAASETVRCELAEKEGHAEAVLAEKTQTLEEKSSALASAVEKVSETSSVLADKQDVQRAGLETTRATAESKD